MAHASSDSDSDSDTGVNGRTTGSGSVPQGPFQLGDTWRRARTTKP